MLQTFAEWRAAMEQELMRRASITFDDVSWAIEPLEQAFTDGRSPIEFVAWFIDKYNLIDNDVHCWMM